MAAVDPLPEPLQLPRVSIENPSLEIQAAESSQSGPVSVPTVAVPDDVVPKQTVRIKNLKKKYTILLHEKERINNIHV